MGSSVSIDFVLNHDKNIRYILNKFTTKDNWVINDYGKISFLPLHDNDNFNWTSLPFEQMIDFYRIIDEKEENEELIGVVLAWRETMVGGQFLFENPNSLSFLPVMNRVLLKDTKFTDINWYLEKIIPLLSEVGDGIESIEFSEHV